MAREAVEGKIDLRASDQKKQFDAIFKFPKPINRWHKWLVETNAKKFAAEKRIHLTALPGEVDKGVWDAAWSLPVS